MKLAKVTRKALPMLDDPNIRTFYLFTFLANGWFQIGNWLLFVLLFMTAPEFAVYEAIAFGFGIVLEIPSGALADQIGRKRTAVIGILLQSLGAGIFIFGFIHNSYFFIGNLLLVSSFAFISGSLDALIYDHLKQRQKESHFDDILGKSRGLGAAAMILAGVIGGLLWQVNMYIPLVLTTVSFFAAFLVSLKLTEPKLNTEENSLATFAAQTGRGLHYLFHTPLRKYTYSFFVILASYIMWSEGFIRLVMAKDFGFDGSSTNYLVSFTLVLGLVATYFFSQIRKRFGDLIGFSTVLALASIMWILSGQFTQSRLAGFVVFSFLTITGTLAQLWTSVIANKHIKSKDRATALSALSFIVQIPYVIALIMVKDVTNTGEQKLLYTITGLLIMVGIGTFYRAERAQVLVRG